MSGSFALICGRLLHAPEERRVSNGRTAATATLKVGAGDHAEFWIVSAFANAARAELMRLTAGDHVACQGVMRITSQRIAGDVVTQRHLAADLVVSLRPEGL
jgi:phage tail sheath gpL-like